MAEERKQARTGTWTLVAGREGGTVTALALSPNFERDELAFAATHAGLYRTTDSGRSWEPCGGGLTNPFVEAVAASPQYTDDHTVFLGTRDGTLFRSTDGGHSWTCLGWLGERSAVIAVVISPNYSEDGTVLAGTFEDGVYRSHDRGATWTSSNFGLLDLSVMAMSISPDFATDETVFLATPTGAYRSRNGGRSWKEVDMGQEELSVQALAVSPGFAADRTVFAGLEEGGVYRSTDGGDTFRPVDPTGADLCINALAVSPGFAADRTLLAATADGIRLSCDGGEHWETVEADIADALCLGNGKEASGDTVVLAGMHQAGIARSSDGGRTWGVVNRGLAGGSLTGIALSPALAEDGTLFAWGLEEGVMRSGDGGQTWEPADAGLEDTQATSLAISPAFTTDAVLLAATANGVYRSSDRGASWTATGLGDQPGRTVALSPAFPQDETVAAVASGLVFASEDGGEQWQRLETPFAGNEILALEFSPDYRSDRALYVAVRQGQGEEAEVQVFRGTRRQGIRWECLFSQKSAFGLATLAIPTTVRSNGAFFVGLGGRVYRQMAGSRETTAHGQHPIWLSETVGRRDAAVVTLAPSPDFGRDRTLFAATSDGVYRSRNAGLSWEEMSTGLTRRSVIAVLPSPSYAADGTLYALTLGGGIWRYRA